MLYNWQEDSPISIALKQGDRESVVESRKGLF